MIREKQRSKHERPPLLYFIAPALRIHPATETVLGYLSREIEWNLIAVGEEWRRSLDVIWRKRGGGNA